MNAFELDVRRMQSILATEGEPDLPNIQVNARELRDVSADALSSLVASNDPPRLFVRGASIVRVDESGEGRPLIVRLTDRHLIGEMTRAADLTQRRTYSLDPFRNSSFQH
jgi:hypothetical protein